MSATNHDCELADRLLASARELLLEVVREHADPESHAYNECDTDPCMWCDEAKKFIEAVPPPEIKT